MTRYLIFFLLFFCGIYLSHLAPVAEAQIQWRYNYAKARKEAKSKGLPIILDFGTENCFWCRKLDETTFQDPTVSQTLNKQFVPLKIDADREYRLAQQLRIHSYPTIVFADFDGKILGTIEGYRNATRFQESLNRVLAQVANPEWMLRDFAAANKALATPDYAKAIALLKSVTEDGKGRPIQMKARKLLTEIENQATVQLAKAKQLNENGKTTKAMDLLTELVRSYPGTNAAVSAGEMLTRSAKTPTAVSKQRTQVAREILAQARNDYNSGQYLHCLDRCEKLISTYGDLKVVEDARRLKGTINDNPEWLQDACDELSGRLSRMYIDLAKSYLRKNQRHQAMAAYQRVIQNFPNSRYAEYAQTRLAQLRGQAMRTVDFHKQ